MDYSKHFTDHTDYEAYINSSVFLTPSLDVCDKEFGTEVHYHRPPEKYVTCIYDVSTTAINTLLMNNTTYNSLSFVKTMWIDDVEVTKSASYRFSTTGKHTVIYDISLNQSNNSLPMCFNGCDALEEITIPNKCTALHSSGTTFTNCYSLRKINNIHKDFRPMPSLNGDDFCYSSIEYIKIPAEVEGADSRRNCNAVIDTSKNELIIGTSHTIVPGDVSSIGYCSFQGRKELTQLIIPRNIKLLGDTALSDTGLTSIHIPGTCKEIKNYCFLRTEFLTSITLEEGIETIGAEAFQGSGLSGHVEIPGSVQGIATALFKNSNISSLKVNEGTSILYYGAFNMMTSLQSLDLPSTITSIGNNYNGLYNNQTGYAFAWNPNLTSITCRAVTPPTLISGTTGGIASNFIRVQDDTATYLYNSTPYCYLYVPAGSVAAYKAATGWSAFGDKILPIPS